MITGIIIALFIIQLITIFVIILLNSKLSKFKDLEIRQNQLIREMDDAISLYLVEMKEENDRLIMELQQTTGKMNAPQVTKPLSSVGVEAPPEQKTNMDQNEQVSLSTEEVSGLEIRPYIPKTMATNAYIKQKVQSAEEELQVELEPNKQRPIEQEVVTEVSQKELTYEEQVISFHKAGMGIEEIAKALQRGKTEIELLIRFHA